MINWFRRLNIEFQTVVWSIIVTLGLLLLMIPLFFFSLMEIPLGIALGAAIGIITYLALGLVENKSKQKLSIGLTITIIVLRLLVIAGILFLVGWLYYAKEVKIFNIFAVVGGYFMTLVINIILVRKEKVGALS